LDALCTRITAGSYTLLHVVCHGQFTSDDGETFLYLADEAGRVDRVTASRLIERLRRLRGAHGLPRFAFLATCESAHPAAEGALGGLA
jgi:CHAT domain-containing protein